LLLLDFGINGRRETNRLLHTQSLLPLPMIMEPIHDRMPVNLHERDEGRWLDPELQDPEQIVSLLKPFPAEEMEAFVVSTFVNSPKNDVPECIEPI